MRKPISKPMMRAIVTLGAILGGGDWLRLNLDMLSRHVFIAGGTGGGKTMLLLLLMRQLISQGVGFTFITPHPDGREKLLHWCHLNKIDPARIVDVKPSPQCCISIDPFAHPPKDCTPLEYEAWLRATVGRVVSAILRNVPIAEQEVMNRLKRWLKNVLYCCGKDVDGEHLGIDKALILLDPNHPQFDAIMDRLLPHLPGEIRSDFINFRETKNPRQREQWVESTINRVRELLESILVRQMFGQKAPAVNDEEIIEDSMIQIVSVPESDYLSRDQGNVIAGLRISAMMAAAKRIADRVPEDKRAYHFLIIDEAENFVGEDLRTGFQELRKFRMPIIIVVQDISCLLKGDMDLLSKVASQCGVQCTANQQDPDSLDYLSRAFSAPFLDLTPLYGLQALPVGHEVIQTQSVSFSSSEGISVGEAESITRTHSVTKQRHTGQSIQESVSMALSSTHSEGGSEGASVGGSVGVSHGSNWSQGTSKSRQVTDSESQARSKQRSTSVGESETATDSESHAASKQKSSSVSASTSHQVSSSEGTSSSHSSTSTEGRSRREHSSDYDTVNRGRSRGDTSGTSSSRSSSQGETQSRGESESEGQTHTTGRSTSRGTTRTTGESEGETETRVRAVSEGESQTQSVGGSTTQSQQANWSKTAGRNWSDSAGVTHGRSAGSGRSWGESSGESNGQSIGHTDTHSATQSTGVSVAYNQVPLALHEIIRIHTGKLVVSIPDQIAAFTQCMASLKDRVMLVKVRGMNRPFLLRVHTVEDPYEQKKLLRCEEWRQELLKRYVAKIRKAHPWYFLPSFDDERVPAAKPRQDDKRPKRKLEESPMS